MLLEEAYEAAERLKQAHDAGAQIEAPGDELADTAETARRDLDRIFNTGGVATLVGNTYGAAKDVVNDFPTIIVDVVGVGAGVYDRLVELGLPVVAYNGGGGAVRQGAFVNARAEDYWNLRELFENGEIDIDELDDVLAAQLGSLK